MTLGAILAMRGIPTESKYEIMQRADRVLADRCGRYYGGTLTSDEVRQLTDGVEMSQSVKDVLGEDQRAHPPATNA